MVLPAGHGPLARLAWGWQVTDLSSVRVQWVGNMGQDATKLGFCDLLREFRRLQGDRQNARTEYEATQRDSVEPIAASLAWEKIADQIGDSIFSVSMAVILQPSKNLDELRVKAEVLREYVTGADEDIVDLGARTICDELIALVAGSPVRPHTVMSLKK